MRPLISLERACDYGGIQGLVWAVMVVGDLAVALAGEEVLMAVRMLLGLFCPAVSGVVVNSKL